MTDSVLLFDLGGVLVDLGDPVAAMDLEMSNDQFWAIWLSSPLVHEFETGQLSSEQFVARFGAQLGFHDAAEFDQLMRSWQLPMFDESEAFLKSLMGQCEIALLSNTNKIHWQFVQSQTDVFNSFSKLFLSFETGNAKPGVAAFQDVISYFKRNPGDIVFFDDNANNVAAAQSVGLRARQTKGHAAVRQAVDEFLG